MREGPEQTAVLEAAQFQQGLDAAGVVDALLEPFLQPLPQFLQAGGRNALLQPGLEPLAKGLRPLAALVRKSTRLNSSH